MVAVMSNALLRDVMPMLLTHCPLCKGRINCTDMKRCPLALAKWKGEFISPEQFAGSFGDPPPKVVAKPVPPPSNAAGQFDLF